MIIYMYKNATVLEKYDAELYTEETNISFNLDGSGFSVGKHIKYRGEFLAIRKKDTEVQIASMIEKGVERI